MPFCGVTLGLPTSRGEKEMECGVLLFESCLRYPIRASGCTKVCRICKCGGERRKRRRREEEEEEEEEEKEEGKEEEEEEYK